MSDKLNKKEENQLANTYNYGDQAGGGYGDDFGAADMTIPMMILLQDNSGVVKEKETPGAVGGAIFNPVMKKVFPSEAKQKEAGIMFQPCFRQHVYVEWIPVDDGGGLVATYNKNAPEVAAAIKANGGNRFGKIPINDTHYLAETVYLFGNLLDDDGEVIEGMVVIPFSSMKLKPLKDLMTALYTLRGKPPLYANRIRLQTTLEKKAKLSWYNFTISPLEEGDWSSGLLAPDSELFLSGKELAEAVSSGAKQADLSTYDNNDEVSQEDEVDF